MSQLKYFVPATGSPFTPTSVAGTVVGISSTANVAVGMFVENASAGVNTTISSIGTGTVTVALGTGITTSTPLVIGSWVTAVVGSQGLQGNQGIQGVQGVQGVQGIQGAQSTLIGPQGYQGNQGNQGFQGNQSSIAVGTVTTTAYPNSAIVTNVSATAGQAVFNFTLPQGPQGNQGNQGSQGNSAVSQNAVFNAPYEAFTLGGSSIASSSTVTIALATNPAFAYYNGGVGGQYTIAITGAPTTSGQSATVVFSVLNGSTAYAPYTYTLNGTNSYSSTTQFPPSGNTTNGITTFWQGGTAPSSANPSTVDVYTFTIMSTGTSTWTVFASQVKY